MYIILYSNIICIYIFLFYILREYSNVPLFSIWQQLYVSNKLIKFLGILIDSNHDFKYHVFLNKYHVNNVNTNVARAVELIYRLNEYLPPNILKRLYLTITLPHITNGTEPIGDLNHNEREY